jgi:hypothetical protein
MPRAGSERRARATVSGSGLGGLRLPGAAFSDDVDGRDAPGHDLERGCALLRSSTWSLRAQWQHTGVARPPHASPHGPATSFDQLPCRTVPSDDFEPRRGRWKRSRGRTRPPPRNWLLRRRSLFLACGITPRRPMTHCLHPESVITVTK